MKKKLMSLVLVFALILGTFSTTGAAAGPNEFAPSANEEAAIIATFQYIEDDKDAFDLEDVEFSDLNIGNRIYAYEYTESGLNELYFAFPIFYNGEIVALATKVSENDFQISGNLAKELNEIRNSSIALVYDANAVYAFNGLSFSLLDTSPVTIPDRQSFQNGYPDVGTNEIELCDLNYNAELNYSSAAKARVQTYFSCPVKNVPQGNGTNICWAATIACIVNYVKNRNLTAKDVAVAYYGATSYNWGLETSKCDDVLNDTYDLNYTYLNHVPSDAIILENIQSGYPLYGGFSGQNMNHAGTVFGINLVSGYITVMDPMTGSTTARSKNGEFSYVNTTTGKTLTLDRTVCHIWG